MGTQQKKLNKRIIKFVDLHRQYLNIKKQVDAQIKNTIKLSNFIRGSNVNSFEKNFAKKNKSKYCLSCGNGTDALFIALKALNLKKDDEVITTAHSWISTSEAITLAGAKVVFVDTNLNNFNINYEDIIKKITKKTVGIIPVHLFGQTVNMKKITQIAKNYNLWIIEDCAQAAFAKFENKFVGNFGIFGTFSFYPGKNLGAFGDAGAIITNNTKMFKKISMFARHGGLTKGDHIIEGMNSRMDGMQAGILDVKLKYIFEWNKRRKVIASTYNNNLRNIGDIVTPELDKGCDHIYHLYVIKTKFRDGLRKFLNSHKVETNINYPKALPFLKAYNYLGHKSLDFPNAYKNQNDILSLPIYPELKNSEVIYICKLIKNFFNKN